MVHYNPFVHSIVDDAYAVYKQLRDEAPVYHNAELDFYALSRFDDVLAAHLDPQTFSSRHGVTIENLEAGQPFLITQDPPEHTALRKIVSRLFTPRSIGHMEGFIRDTARRLLDPFVGSDGFDVVTDFSFRLPLDVISELTGIPVELRERVHELSDEMAVRDGKEIRPEDAVAASEALAALFYELVVDRRKNLGDDVISLMITTPVATADGGERMMTDDELTRRFVELAFAGHETVAKLIANGMVALAWYPEARRELAADPSLIPQAIEEMLRWDPPSHYQGRWSTRDVEVHGVTIPADSRVILITGSAGHDERHYPDPEVFDIHRPIDRHVSLGFGIHLCLGAALARLETRIAFEELLARFPDFSVAEHGVVRQYSSNVRGLAQLPIVIERATAGV